MINEFKTLLVNSAEGKGYFATSPHFAPVQMNQMEKTIRNAILGEKSSMKYKATVANFISESCYADSELEDIMERNFSHRNVPSSSLSINLVSPRIRSENHSHKIEINIDECFANTKNNIVSYSITRDDANTVLVVSSLSNKKQKIKFDSIELVGTSKWKTLDDTGCRVKFFFSGEEVPQGLSVDFSIFVPFEIKINNIADELKSVGGLSGFMHETRADGHEDIYQLYSGSRPERRVFAIAIALALSIKKKIKK